ncbi:MAG: DUF6515 family protein [Bacteroidota bacterium]
MKTKHYTTAVVFLLTAFLLFSADSFAQPGRYRNSRGYNRPHSARYYPQRNYYYNQPYVSVRFGNNNYRYQRGYYYRPYGASLRIVVPPFGIRIATLPFGYRSFYVGPDPYYYYGGTYYRPYQGNQYEVVAPPLGAVVDELPPGAKVAVIDGQKYYELNGTYYQEEITKDSDLQYTVVGTDGVLNTGSTTDEKVGPVVGDRFDAVPADSKAVVIKGEKLYVSPAGLYYKEVIDGDKVLYEVVGK